MFKKIKHLWSDKDERSLLINVFLAFAIKGLSLFVSLFSMPLYIRYFDNNDVLGVWYTILSVLSWITICDLGLGNGLRNNFTVAYTKGDKVLAKRYIASTYISLFSMVFPIVGIGCFAIPLLNLHEFLNLPIGLIDKKSLTVSVIILLIGLGCNFVLKSINSIIYAIQKSSINNIIALIVSVLPLLYILVAPNGTLAENLIRMSVVHVIAINLPLIIATFIVFATECKQYVPTFRNFDITIAKQMLGTGMKFFFAQIFFMVLMSTNEFFITKMFSSNEVVVYSAYYKIFMLVGSLFMLALTPLWSKVTKDLSEGRYFKIKATNKVLYALSVAAAVAEFVLVLIIQFVFDFWLGKGTVQAETGTALIFALFGALYIFNVVLTTVANGMGELRTQTIIYGIGAAFKIPVTMLFKNLYNHWVVVVAYNCIVLLIFCVIQIVWVKKRINRLIKSGG